MTFHIVTIFPKIFDSYFSESIVKRAREKELTASQHPMLGNKKFTTIHIIKNLI